jgi:2-iminobutanoate/2-iminopropanoate deaminase
MATRTIISTSNAPAAVGPYSQAIRVGDMLYTSGQIAIDPATGEMSTGDVQAQAEQALRNLAAVLEAGGSSMKAVVKTMVFLADMADFKPMNEVYARHFGDALPARSCVAAAALPLGAKFEIEAIGLVSE